MSRQTEAEGLDTGFDLPPMFAPASRFMAEVPWALAPALRARVNELQEGLARAMRAQHEGDPRTAGREAAAVIEAVCDQSHDDPVGRFEFDRLGVPALAALARALGTLAKQEKASEVLRSAHEQCVAAHGGAAEPHARWESELVEHALEWAPREPTLLGLLADVLADQGRSVEAAGRLRQRAEELAERDRYDDALAALDKSIQLDPNNRETHIGRGDVLRLASRHADAREALRPALEDPPDTRAVTIEGLLLLSEGHPTAARDVLTRVLEAEPDQGWAHWNLALALQALGERDLAHAEVDRALDLDGERAMRVLQKGILITDDGRYDEGLTLIERALELHPGLTSGLIARADTLRALGRLHEARTSVEDALRREPRSANAHGVRGAVLAAGGDLTAAAEELAEASVLNPHKSWVHLALGEVRLALDDLPGAAAAFDRALELNPASERALTGKAEIARREGNLKEAEQTLDSALDVAPESARAATRRAQVLYEQDDMAGAERELRGIIDVHPSHAEAHALLGEVLRMQGRKEEALEALEDALRIDPESAFALGTRGQVRLSLRQLDDGVADLRGTLEKAPDLAWARISLGDGLRALGRRDEALAEFERVVHDAPDPDAIRVRICEIYQSNERYDEAEAILTEILERQPDYVEAIVLRGNIQASTARFSEALETLTAVTEGDDEHDWAHYLRGWCHRNLGDDHRELARAEYERALELDPSWPEYHQKLGDVIALTDAEAARPHFEWVLENVEPPPDGSDAYAVLIVGWAQSGLGRYTDAARSFGLALEAAPDDLPTRFDLALALLASGRTELAVREYREAINTAKTEDRMRRRCVLGVAARELRETTERLQVDSQPAEGETAERELRELIQAITEINADLSAALHQAETV